MVKSKSRGFVPGSRYLLALLYLIGGLACLFIVSKAAYHPAVCLLLYGGAALSLSLFSGAVINIMKGDQLVETSPESLSLTTRKRLRRLALCLPLPIIGYLAGSLALSVYARQAEDLSPLLQVKRQEEALLGTSFTWQLLPQNIRERAEAQVQADSGYFMQSLQQSIKEHWQPQSNGTTYRAAVAFQVNSQGRIVNDRIMEVFGDGVDVDAIKAALEGASGSTPLPPSLEAPVDVDFTFEYNYMTR